MKNLLLVAMLALTAIPSFTVDAFDTDALIEKCISENNKFEMKKYCILKQTKAIKSLTVIINGLASQARTDVYTGCVSEWVNDPNMQLFCTLDGFSTLDKLNIK